MKKGFTLAEVLITLAIIGVVAALTIPSVIANTQQQEFKTGLRKAVSALNSAITTNIAIDGESPYDNSNLFGYLARHMSIIRSTSDLMKDPQGFQQGSTYWTNAAFYTTDGMRYEFRAGVTANTGNNVLKLYENNNVAVCLSGLAGGYENYQSHDCDGAPEGSGGCAEDKTTKVNTQCGKGCGSFGLNDNPYNTSKPPCLILVDVNGDRKPNPANAKCHDASCGMQNSYKIALPNEKKVTDIFSIMITDSKAIPYGVVAQRSMYNHK